MAEARPRRLTVTVGAVVALVVIFLVFIVLPLSTAERKVRAFCAGVQAGVGWPALAMAAGAQGLRVVTAGDQLSATIADGAAFARFVCQVRIGADGRVIDSHFNP